MAKDVIARLKADTSQWDSGLSRAGRSLDQFQQKNISLDAALQGSVRTLVRVGAQYASMGVAATAAMKVVKDAFMSSESNMDSWGGTVESVKSIYDSFCISLNNSSLDGWFSNMDNLINKARQAYDAIDDLNTKMTIINPERVKIQGLITEQKEIIRKNGRESDAGKAAVAEINRLEPILKDTYTREAKMNYNAFEAEVKKKLEEAGLGNLDSKSYRWLMRSFSSESEYERLKAGAKTTVVGTGRYNLDEYGHAVGEEIKVSVKNTNQKLLDLFTDEWRAQYSQYLTASYSAKNSAFQVGIQDARYTRGGSGGNSSSSSSSSSSRYSSGLSGISDISGLAFGATKSMKELNEELARYKKMKEEATTSFEYNEAIEGIEQVQKEIAVQPITLQLGVDAEKIVPIQEIINNFFKEHPITPEMKLPTNFFPSVSKSAEDTANAWKEATRAISNAGNAMTNLEDPSAKVAGIVMQAIANIALGFAQASASPATGLAGVFGWIAAVTAGVATMTATIAQIKSATEYHAQGGMVGTSPFIPKGTDTVPAMLTPGEIVLNAAQQRNMANNLQGTSNVVMQSSGESRISGEEIITVINAYGRRTGRGEILV